MPTSLSDQQVLDTLAAASVVTSIQVKVSGQPKPASIPKPFPSPMDWRDQWIYFIMVDRFNNPHRKPNSHWDKSTEERQGGTFDGIKKELSYLHDLGAGAIWISPILKNRQSPARGSHHGYGIMDFLDIDPRFGTTPARAESEFISLVDEAHARGMWVVLDIVINHAGDVFSYDINGKDFDAADWNGSPYQIHWRDQTGQAHTGWHTVPESQNLSRDAVVWPAEFQKNEMFRRQGKGGVVEGDFETLKEFKTDLTKADGEKPVLELLIKSYEYIIARYDVDGFRIDTLKHVERDFALTFCNAIREFAQSIGKKNFFIFGENKSDDEGLLADYIGRYTSDMSEQMGADAALDFPLQWRMVPVVKGFAPPTALEDMFAHRKMVQKERKLLNSHGEASRFFVTFLDNHDEITRFLYPRDGGIYTPQLTMAVACLFCLQGIPCLYYGTEQGLMGVRDLYEVDLSHTIMRPENVREALWGKANAFDENNEIYQEIRKISRIRMNEPALRYGRQYFRPVSGNGVDFGVSREKGGVLAVSRILYNREVVVVANTSTTVAYTGSVLVDRKLHTSRSQFELVYSNYNTQGINKVQSGMVQFYDRQNIMSSGEANWINVILAPMEAQVLIPKLLKKPLPPISGEPVTGLEGNIN